MANRHKEHKKEHKKKMSSGGKAEPKVNEYNAEDSPEVGEAKDKKEGFKRGGGVKHAGMADGMKSHKRLDKKPRKLAAGGSAFSEAKKMSMYGTGGAGNGHQGDGMKGEDRENT